MRDFPNFHYYYTATEDQRNCTRQYIQQSFTWTRPQYFPDALRLETESLSQNSTVDSKWSLNRIEMLQSNKTLWPFFALCGSILGLFAIAVGIILMTYSLVITVM
jgi:hypothetical protein